MFETGHFLQLLRPEKSEGSRETKRVKRFFFSKANFFFFFYCRSPNWPLQENYSLKRVSIEDEAAQDGKKMLEEIFRIFLSYDGNGNWHR